MHLAAKKSVDGSGQEAMITDLQFGMFGSGEITALGEFELVSDKGYEQPNRVPVVGGVVDRRLGVSDKLNICNTCGSRMNDCPGHYGYIKLELPIFHIGYLKPTLSVLQSICKSCSRVLLPEKERQKMLRQVAHPMVAGDSVRRAAFFKRMLEACKKVKVCPYCEAANGTVRRYGCIKIVHEKYPPKQKGEKAEQHRKVHTGRIREAWGFAGLHRTLLYSAVPAVLCCPRCTRCTPLPAPGLHAPPPLHLTAP